MSTERPNTRTLLLAAVGIGIVVGVAGTVTLGPVVDDYTTTDELAPDLPAWIVEFEYNEADGTMKIEHIEGEVLNESNVNRLYVTVDDDPEGVVVRSDGGTDYTGMWATDRGELAATEYPITEGDSVTVVGVVEDGEVRPLEPGEEVAIVVDTSDVFDTVNSHEVPE